MPGRDKIKTSGSDFGQGFSPKKKDYVGLGKPSKKKDYVGLGKPDTKKIKQKDDKSDFSGGNKFTPKVTKSIVSKKSNGNKTKTSTNKPRIVSKKELKALMVIKLRLVHHQLLVPHLKQLEKNKERAVLLHIKVKSIVPTEQTTRRKQRRLLKPHQMSVKVV